jgi:hypothetical protein
LHWERFEGVEQQIRLFRLPKEQKLAYVALEKLAIPFRPALKCSQYSERYTMEKLEQEPPTYPLQNYEQQGTSK